MTKYCPKCGEPVPSSATECPKCYAKITESAPEVHEFKDTSKKRISTHSIMMALAILPGFLGILGLGLVYKDRSNKRWMLYLAVGMFFFIIGNILLIFPAGLIGTIIKTILGIAFMLAYLITFIVSVLDTLSGFHISYRRI